MVGMDISKIERLIHVVRGQRVMLDADIAVLYRVVTGALNRAVLRNPERFPADFMFQLTEEEYGLICQIGISKKRRGGRRFLPYAFTEHGVAMLSSVLNSEEAIQVNISIIRAFVRQRRVMAANPDLTTRMESAERLLNEHDDELGEHGARINDLLAAMGKRAKRGR
jgi:hypothetical protein